jgi:hypothetical protein
MIKFDRCLLGKLRVNKDSRSDGRVEEIRRWMSLKNVARPISFEWQCACDLIISQDDSRSLTGWREVRWANKLWSSKIHFMIVHPNGTEFPVRGKNGCGLEGQFTRLPKISFDSKCREILTLRGDATHLCLFDILNRALSFDLSLPDVNSVLLC